MCILVIFNKRSMCSLTEIQDETQIRIELLQDNLDLLVKMKLLRLLAGKFCINNDKNAALSTSTDPKDKKGFVYKELKVPIDVSNDYICILFCYK